MGDGLDEPRSVAPGPGRSGRRFVAVTLLMPVLAATLGVGGGPIFQIVAVENLGISSVALGIAFGLGVVSLPLQIAASRIPLRRARPNMQVFLVLTALQAWILAALVAVGATGGVAAIALAVTVTAELAVSILFATAWQPLLSVGVDAEGRQRLNSTWQAIARGVLAGSLVVFEALSGRGRPVFLVAVGVAALAAAVGFRAVMPPDRSTEEDTSGGGTGTPETTNQPATIDAAATGEPPVDRVLPPGSRLRFRPRVLTVVFVVFGVANLGAMPLWLVYLDEILWLAGNLGLVGAVQIVAAMAAMLAWRPTEGEVSGRAFGASVITLVGCCSVVFVQAPAPGTAGRALILAATALTAIGVTTTRIALVEQVHCEVNTGTAVRVFTLVDVIASTSLQIGLLAAGFLISAAAATSGWAVDPYQLLILAAAATTVLATHLLRRARA